MRKGFTLIELLVVLAIVVVLSALLFPVFASARAAARGAACLNNYRQVSTAQNLYIADYEDRVVPASYRTDANANPLNDRKWPQLLLPYSARNFGIFQCPEDKSPRPSIESLFSADLSLADPDAKLYVQAERTNLGYNAIYFSPRVSTPFGVQSWPISTSEVALPAGTYVYLDSVWETSSGIPRGGGNYVVQPPCRYARLGTTMVDTTIDDPMDDPRPGWQPSPKPHARTYGGVWAWHGKKATVAFLDGHVKPVEVTQLSQGCAVEPSWGGAILDFNLYSWDLR